MPNPPRRLRTAGRRLWTDVHNRNRLTIHEGIRLARACELADRVARLESLNANRPARPVPTTELDAARAHLADALREVGPIALLPHERSTEPAAVARQHAQSAGQR